mgnify:CR=1 FL=1
MKKKPNLVVIFTDQQRYDTMAVYGNNKIRTPGLNRLAAESTVFEKAYVSQPVCTPSRATIMTGLYPHNHHCQVNSRPLNGEIPTLVEQLADPEYRSAYIGKWHIGNEIKRQHGFDEWVTTEDNYFNEFDDPDSKGHCSYYYHLLGKGFHPDQYSKKKDSYIFSRYFCTRLPEQYSKEAYQAAEAVRFIRRNKDGSFILYVNFLDPHGPNYSVYDDLYDPGEVNLSPAFDLEPSEDIPTRCKLNRRYYAEISQDDQPFNGVLKSEADYRRLTARYWGQVSLVDKYTGVILDALKENGVEDDTIVAFTSDHGDMLGDFRMAAKSVLFDKAVRVPLLIKIPGRTSGNVIKEPVSLVDLVPTLLEAMGSEGIKKMDGKSLYSVVVGDETPGNNDVFVQWYGDNGLKKWVTLYSDPEERKRLTELCSAGVRMLVTRDGWRLSLSENGENELYNLNEDPYETKNLYYTGRCQDIVEELSGRILRWQKQYGDSAVLLMGREGG